MKRKDPAAVALGRKGGRWRGKKGFATMSRKWLVEIQEKARLARMRKRVGCVEADGEEE